MIAQGICSWMAFFLSLSVGSITCRQTSSPAPINIPSQEVHDYEWVNVTNTAAFAPGKAQGH